MRRQIEYKWGRGIEDENIWKNLICSCVITTGFGQRVSLKSQGYRKYVSNQALSRFTARFLTGVSVMHEAVSLLWHIQCFD